MSVYILEAARVNPRPRRLSQSLSQRIEERQCGRMPESRCHQRSVEVAVESFAGGLGDEQAALTGGAFEKSFGMVALRRVARADRIVLPLDLATAYRYGVLKAALQKKGRPIPENDL